jgi:ribosome-associated protein YbcJ (S4-like RNA binding protein)
MNEIRLRQADITLAQALKAAGIAVTGGQAKHQIREGTIMVNGTVERRPGAKLVEGDRIQSNGIEWTISRESES